MALAKADASDFVPEPIKAGHVAGWSADLLKRTQRLCDMLGAARATLNEADRALADRLLERSETLPALVSTLLPSDLDGLNLRQHGDFRLGQILIVKDDICIIDFDGNTNFSLAERRRKWPAARDVAGLVYSIDLAVSAALSRALRGAADEQGRLGRSLRDWRERATATFLTAYREALTDQRLWPKDPHSADSLLKFFLLDKAFHEVEYELSHRPEGLNASLAGLLRILSNGESEAHA
jgi:maltose alpha-D-glucosyltransferase/alpha-amylase